MSVLVSIIPLDLNIHGEPFKRNLLFNGNNVLSYRQYLTEVLQEVCNKLKPSSSLEWYTALMNIEKHFMKMSNFWLNDIFKPLHERVTLPMHDRICHCHTQVCKRDLFHFCHFEENGEMWRANLWDGTWSYNCARRSPEDTERLICFYENCIKNYVKDPKKYCCPINFAAIVDLKILLFNTSDIFHNACAMKPTTHNSYFNVCSIM